MRITNCISCKIINNQIQQIQKLKKDIELLVNDKRFIFDKLIKNVVTNTVYFDDKLDPIQNYKFLYRLENVT